MSVLRTNIYIDGFNLYYGSLRKTKYKWLNPEALCQRLLSQDSKATYTINQIKYFSARIIDTPDDLGKSQRQNEYFRVLRTLPNLEVILGHYSKHIKEMRLEPPIELEEEIPFINKTKKRKIDRWTVVKFEEKGSDVNLATHILVDAVDNNFDVAVVISNDSDLRAPLRFAKNKFNKKIVIFSPYQNNSISLKKHANYMKKISEADVKQCQFKSELIDSKGSKIKKPSNW